MYKKELEIAKQVSIKSGKFLKKEFNNWQRGQGKYKKGHEIVTWCDKKSEKIIFKDLKKYFPKYNILSEEAGQKNKKSDYTWIIDPLDGTANFTIHNPLFSVSIALVYKKEIILGVTYIPILNEIYYASKNKGAFKNNKKIKISHINTLKESFLTYCHGKDLGDTKKAYKIYEYLHIKARDCRHFGSTTIELAMVAGGKTEALIVPKANIWDIAAGIILIKEAGGDVTNWQNKDWDFKSKNLIASNKKIHNILIKIIKKLKLV